MRRILFILPLFWLNSHAQSHWHTISYVLDSNGREISKRLPDSKWEISDSLQTIQLLYAENERLKEKYALAMGILKLLNQQGMPVDREKYKQAVLKFNNQ